MRIAQSVKTDEEIELMRIAGHKLARVHEALRKFIRPGISTKSIDEFGERLILEEGGIPNFKNYGGYPASICVSVNDEIVHGIPSEERILREGDIVSLDAGLIWKGYHSVILLLKENLRGEQLMKCYRLRLSIWFKSISIIT